MELKNKNLGYSSKNIPISSQQNFIKIMICQIEKFIRRLRWKAFFLDQQNHTAAETETYGFQSENAPLQHKNLNAFENDLYELVKSIQFKKVRNQFQQQLASDVKEIKKSSNMFVSADKTTNLYKLQVPHYRKLLNENITSTYKKTGREPLNHINTEAQAIARDLKLDDRIESFAKREAFVTLKDHKDNFVSHPKCRIINPAKSEIGKISKHHMDTINTTIRKKTKLNQWHSTSSVIAWFSINVPKKNECKFLKFDIVNFYPSITEELLTASIGFAREHMEISDETINIIMHARKSLLFNPQGETWTKKSGGCFNVTMGSFDGAEVCELVGLFILQQLSQVITSNAMGLYRDDGLAILRNTSRPGVERIRKNISKTFQQHGLQVTTEANMIETGFLDITLNFSSGKFWPYRKPNNQPLYIHAASNHPPIIKKHLPSMIAKRVSEISYNEDEFKKAIPLYNEALKNSGYASSLTFQQEQPKRKSRARKRNVICLNPPAQRHRQNQHWQGVF